MGINRRDFLKILALAGGAGVLGAPKKALAQEDFLGWPDRYGVLYDTSLCIGCRSCEARCNEVNSLPAPDVPFDDPKVFEQIRRPIYKAYTVVNRYYPNGQGSDPTFVKVQCMHCNEPACFAACVAKAFTKTPDGAVKYDPDVCIGCRYCMQACPFYIPAYEYHSAFSPRVTKCTMCHDRILQGKVPGCVEVCPTGALIFGKRKDLITYARKKILSGQGYIDHIYGENEMGGSSWMYISKAPFEKLGFKMDLGLTAAPKYVYWFLWTIPLWHTAFTALLTGIYSMSKRREQVAKEEIAKAVEERTKSGLYVISSESEIDKKGKVNQ